METGRVISRRYLLQRLIKQGQFSVVYQGIDQVLQRIVTVKAVPASQVAAYRAAIKMTAHFSHPNIVGLYDLVLEAESLYLVQEYVDGEDLLALQQKSLSPFEVTDIGIQICQALMYAGSSTRKVSHGDLTPSAVMRDHNGLVRVNNFALPSDLNYFQAWSVMGADGLVLSDPELPWGAQSEGRKDDDTRAVGLLLYQLLAGKTTSGLGGPPPDGRLRFQRNTPPELCETVARAVVRQHPQHIRAPEALYAELKPLAEALEAPVVTPSAPAYMPEEPLVARPFSPTAGKLATALPVRDTEQPGLSAYRPSQSTKLPVADVTPSAPTIADVPVKLATAKPVVYPITEPEGKTHSPALLILLIGLIAFVALFVIGYFAGQFLIH
ncbi:MAG TPA: protein kinase [Ktedonobacteraceae bacterium]|nr:protein kinase [Ktedonobacteraceae bacterium]